MPTVADFSGYGIHGTQDSAVGGHAKLATAAGTGGHAAEAYYGNTIDVAHPLLDADNRLRGEYSYEAWVYVSGTPQEQQIFGMAQAGATSYLDGLTIDGTLVAWTVKYDNEGDTRLEYETRHPQRLHVVGTHSTEKDQLWVNGELVVEENSTDAQRADTTFNFEHNIAQIGKPLDETELQHLTFNALAIYPKVLSPEIINRHWLVGTSQNSADSIVNGWGGEKFDTCAWGTELFIDSRWATEEDWGLGYMSGIRVVDSSIMPQIVDSVSVGSSWITNVFLSGGAHASIESINISWTGEGADVDVSLDGNTWTPAVDGENISIITSGMDPTDDNLLIRVSFPGGITDDTSYLDSLHVVGISSQESQQIYGRTMTIVDGHRLYNHEPIEQHKKWGARLDTGGTITISSSDDPDAETHAIEIWMKDLPTTNLYTPADLITVQELGKPTKSEVYGDMVSGYWYRVVFLFETSFDSDIVITGPGQIGYVALYSSPWVVADGEEAYAAQYFEYLGAYFNRYVDNDVVQLTQNDLKTYVYENDWTIQAS